MIRVAFAARSSWSSSSSAPLIHRSRDLSLFRPLSFVVLPNKKQQEQEQEQEQDRVPCSSSSRYYRHSHRSWSSVSDHGWTTSTGVVGGGVCGGGGGRTMLTTTSIIPSWTTSDHKQQSKRFYSPTSRTNSKNSSPVGNNETTFTDGSSSSSSSVVSDGGTSVEETLNRLFEDSQQQMNETAVSSASAAAAGGGGGDAWYSAAAAASAAADWTPVWYNIADQAIVAINSFQGFTGLEYGWSIVGVTVIMRLGLFPLMVESQRTTSRMAHLQPEMNEMKRRYEAIGTPSRQDQLQFGTKMKSLFAKYEVKPIRGFLAPLAQLPLFMGMFFGLRKMPSIFPDELSTGGMYWFVDLTVPDPYYVLPAASAGTFLALIELGKDQMMAQNPDQGQMMTNVFRGLALLMIPACVYFESCTVLYWTANNILTLGQTAILKAPAVRKKFGIWEPPKPVPGRYEQAEGLQETAMKLWKKAKGEPTTDEQLMERHNRAVDARKTYRATRAARNASRATRGKEYR